MTNSMTAALKAEAATRCGTSARLPRLVAVVVSLRVAPLVEDDQRSKRRGNNGSDERDRAGFSTRSGESELAETDVRRLMAGARSVVPMVSATAAA